MTIQSFFLIDGVTAANFFNMIILWVLTTSIIASVAGAIIVEEIPAAYRIAAIILSPIVGAALAMLILLVIGFVLCAYYMDTFHKIKRRERTKHAHETRKRRENDSDT